MSEPTPPSPLRLPLTILFAVVMPPLGLVAWIALSGSERGSYLQSTAVRTGLAIIGLSAAPLLLVGTIDTLSGTRSNPIGLGLLMFAGATVGTIVVATAIVVTGRRGR